MSCPLSCPLSLPSVPARCGPPGAGAGGLAPLLSPWCCRAAPGERRPCPGRCRPPGWGPAAARLPGKAACLAPASPGGAATGEGRFNSPRARAGSSFWGVAREGAGRQAGVMDRLQLSSGREKSSGTAFSWLTVSHRGLCRRFLPVVKGPESPGSDLTPTGEHTAGRSLPKHPHWDGEENQEKVIPQAEVRAI